MGRELPPPFTILVDSREQTPLSFGDWPTEVAGLATGDYSIRGYEEQICLERKSIGDLYGCLGHGRDRFERELERMASFEYAAIVIEGSMADVLAGDHVSAQHLLSAAQRVVAAPAGSVRDALIQDLSTEIDTHRVAARGKRSTIPGQAAIGSLITWSVEHALPVWFASDRVCAAATVLRLLQKWFKYRVMIPSEMKGASKL